MKENTFTYNLGRRNYWTLGKFEFVFFFSGAFTIVLKKKNKFEFFILKNNIMKNPHFLISSKNYNNENEYFKIVDK